MTLSTHAILMARISYRQLDYWTRCKYITADTGGNGPGDPREYSVSEVKIAAAMKRLINFGLSVEDAARIARDNFDSRSEPEVLFEGGKLVLTQKLWALGNER